MIGECSKTDNRVYWVDLAKAIAIVAVIIDHTNSILYDDQRIAFFSYFNVSLFIILMGIVQYWSFDRSEERNIEKLKRNMMGILLPYMMATLIYHIVINRGFDLVTYLLYLIHFNASGPFYYVLLYIQLLAVSPVLFYVLRQRKECSFGFLLELVSLIFIVVLSAFTTHYTNVLDVIVGGGKLFGGTYLPLFFIGMIIGKHYESAKKILDRLNPISIITSFCFCALLTVMWGLFVSRDQLTLDKKLPFGDGLNPPGLSLGVYAILMVISLLLMEETCRRINVLSILSSVSIIGRHTLYIFLYHRLVLDYFLQPYIRSVRIKRMTYPIALIAAPLLIEDVLKRLSVFVHKAYE